MKLYLESSVFNFVFADDAPERQKITKTFFDNKLMNFEAFVSDIVFNELGKTKEPKKSALFGLMKRYPLTNLKNSEEAIKLARSYVDAGIIPEKFLNDALHIAIATVNEIDSVVSWNLEHIVKIKTIVEVNKINIKKGYKQVFIITPEEI
ncbi:PIN domain nuclease [Candidatus Woesearchaeota archaeon]|nr:PIN domain nuclease [Candidatus Woesearchaeota archaeon]